MFIAPGGLRATSIDDNRDALSDFESASSAICATTFTRATVVRLTPAGCLCIRNTARPTRKTHSSRQIERIRHKGFEFVLTVYTR